MCASPDEPAKYESRLASVHVQNMYRSSGRRRVRFARRTLFAHISTPGSGQGLRRQSARNLEHSTSCTDISRKRCAGLSLGCCCCGLSRSTDVATPLRYSCGSSRVWKISRSWKGSRAPSCCVARDPNETGHCTVQRSLKISVSCICSSNESQMSNGLSPKPVLNLLAGVGTALVSWWKQRISFAKALGPSSPLLSRPTRYHPQPVNWRHDNPKLLIITRDFTCSYMYLLR